MTDELSVRLCPYFLTQAAINEFVEALRAFRVIFPDSEKQLVKLAQDLLTKLGSLRYNAKYRWI